MYIQSSDNINNTTHPYASTSTECFSILSLPVGAVPIPTFVYTAITFYRMFKQSYSITNLKADELAINLLNPKHRHFPQKMINYFKSSYSEQVTGTEKEVVECKKTVYVDKLGEMQAEVEDYTRKYPWIKFYQSKDIFMQMATGINIQNPGLSKIPRNAHSLFESGIYSRLKKEKYEPRNFRNAS